MGLIRVTYRSKEGYDVACCDCRQGQWWRKAGEAFIRRHLSGLAATARIAWFEDFEEPVVKTQAQLDADYHKGLMR